MSDPLDYHRGRARAELSRGVEAASEAAAAAHLRLAALHLRRLAELARAGQVAGTVASPSLTAALLYARSPCHQTETGNP